ncbi:hypothetical protein LguiA_018901 [Lonicera macranthoides]
MENCLQLSAEGVGQLQEGINLLLSRWSALQMAVDNEWGGRDSRQKPEQLAVDIFSLLTQSKEPVYIDDVENVLDDFMLSLNTEIADGSIEEISEKLMVMHEECLQGNFMSIQRLKETNPPRVAVPHIKQDDESNDTSSSGDDEMDVDDGPESESNVNQIVEDEQPNKAKGTTAEAEDGWTVVPSRRNRGARK